MELRIKGPLSTHLVNSLAAAVTGVIQEIVPEHLQQFSIEVVTTPVLPDASAIEKMVIDNLGPLTEIFKPILETHFGIKISENGVTTNSPALNDFVSPEGVIVKYDDEGNNVLDTPPAPVPPSELPNIVLPAGMGLKETIDNARIVSRQHAKEQSWPTGSMTQTR